MTVNPGQYKNKTAQCPTPLVGPGQINKNTWNINDAFFLVAL